MLCRQPQQPMTTATQTKTFIIRYPVSTYHEVCVERPADISEEELLGSISRQDLTNGMHCDDDAWDSVKDAWREGKADYICDEEYDEIDFC